MICSKDNSGSINSRMHFMMQQLDNSFATYSWCSYVRNIIQTTKRVGFREDYVAFENYGVTVLLSLSQSPSQSIIVPLLIMTIEELSVSLK